MKFYVFCNAAYDGGWIEEFNTLQEAIDYMKKDIKFHFSLLYFKFPTPMFTPSV